MARLMISSCRLASLSSGSSVSSSSITSSRSGVWFVVDPFVRSPFAVLFGPVRARDDGCVLPFAVSMRSREGDARDPLGFRGGDRCLGLSRAPPSLLTGDLDRPSCLRDLWSCLPSLMSRSSRPYLPPLSPSVCRPPRLPSSRSAGVPSRERGGAILDLLLFYVFIPSRVMLV